jgi:hypothetical protein
MATNNFNPDLKVQKIAFEENVNKWNHAFRCIIAGPTNSGNLELFFSSSLT